MDWKQKIAFDFKLRRPAAPSVQRRLGCALSAAYLFPKKTWLHIVTTKMKVISMTEDQILTLINITRERLNTIEKLKTS